MDWDDYRMMAQISAAEMERVLIPGGRAWINVAPSIPFGTNGSRFPLAALWHEALELAQLSYRDTVVWVQDSCDGACAWGSWLSPSAPNLRGSHELILAFYKPPYVRPVPEGRKKGYKAPRTALGGDWTDLTRNVWKMQPARRKKGDAPAQFPIELPARCIRLSTWPGERVLDPFAGVGTTGRAAARLGRKPVLYDLYA